MNRLSTTMTFSSTSTPLSHILRSSCGNSSPAMSLLSFSPSFGMCRGGIIRSFSSINCVSASKGAFSSSSPFVHAQSPSVTAFSSILLSTSLTNSSIRASRIVKYSVPLDLRRFSAAPISDSCAPPSHSKSSSSSHSSSGSSSSSSSSSSSTSSDSSTSSSSSSFLSFFFRFIAWYNRCVERAPFWTHGITGGTLFMLGDITSQFMEYELHHSDPNHFPREFSLTWDRTLLLGAFGLICLGPVGHLWYQFLDRLVVHRLGLSLTKSPVLFLLTKVSVDMLFFSPAVLFLFFATVSAFEGHSSAFIWAKVRRDLMPTWGFEFLFWPPLQLLNFRFMPVSHQLLLVNLFIYLEDIVLSYVQHQGMNAGILKIIDEKWKQILGQERVSKLDQILKSERKQHHVAP